MDTAEIEVFLVLAEELHFGRTAERLRLPQPRVSRTATTPASAETAQLVEEAVDDVQLTGVDHLVVDVHADR